MAQIQITKGLDIPIKGTPTGEVQELARPKTVALVLDPFATTKFKLLVRRGDVVKIGEPLVWDKEYQERVFTSPGSGKVKEVVRGNKRRLLEIVIELDDTDQYHDADKIDVAAADRKSLLETLLKGGLFAHIRQRPANRLAQPDATPRSIFIRALESAPFTPPAEMQVAGFEEEFALGVQALGKLTDGAVHLIHRKGTPCKAFTEAQGAQIHSAEGPHPIANPSVHIHQIDPITSSKDIVWTVSTLDVVCIGHYLKHGRPHLQRVVSISGEGILPDRRCYARVRAGHPVQELIANRVPKGHYRLISGDPLMGCKVDADDHLRFYDTAFCVIPESTSRELLHFFRLGVNKYSHTKTYLSGHLNNSERKYSFDTSRHGEPRPFVTNIPYDSVQPLPVSTILLVKAVMAEDWDLAEELGILEVDSEDFALTTFVCPCKMEQSAIMKEGLNAYAAEVLL